MDTPVKPENDTLYHSTAHRVKHLPACRPVNTITLPRPRQADQPAKPSLHDAAKSRKPEGQDQSTTARRKRSTHPRRVKRLPQGDCPPSCLNHRKVSSVPTLRAHKDKPAVNRSSQQSLSRYGQRVLRTRPSYKGQRQLSSVRLHTDRRSPDKKAYHIRPDCVKQSDKAQPRRGNRKPQAGCKSAVHGGFTAQSLHTQTLPAHFTGAMVTAASLRPTDKGHPTKVSGNLSPHSFAMPRFNRGIHCQQRPLPAMDSPVNA
jgi:hypothetical protein